MQNFFTNLQSYMAQDTMKWLLPVIILLLFVVFFRIFAAMLRKVIETSLAKIGADIPENLSKPLIKSLRLLILVIGIFLAIKAVPFFPPNMFAVVNKISQAVILFFLFQIVYFLMQPIGGLLERADWLMSDLMSQLLMKLLRASVVLVGGVSILELFGIQVAPIIAGFGLLGVAVALGAQDLFKNLIGGLLILAEKQFDVGDWVRADGVFEGIVEDINFRSTLMRGFDKAPVYVPNHSLASTVVTNFSRLPFWRISWTIGVEYRTPTEKLRQICQEIEAMLLAHAEINDPDKAPFAVRIDKFSDSSIDIFVYCFVTSADWYEYLRIKEEVAVSIKSILETAGVGFAFPSQSLYVESLPKEPKP